MPVPSGSIGVSWISQSMNGSPITLPLPVTYSLVYQAPRTPAVTAATARSNNVLVYYRMLTVFPHVTQSSVIGLNVDRLQIHQTNNVGFGLVDTQFVEYYLPEVTIRLTSMSIKYGFVQAPDRRRGVYIQASTGSPHLSLESVSQFPSQYQAGDIWFTNAPQSQSGLYLADYIPNDQFTTESITPQILIASTIPDTFDGGTY